MREPQRLTIVGPTPLRMHEALKRLVTGGAPGRFGGRGTMSAAGRGRVKALLGTCCRGRRSLLLELMMSRFIEGEVRSQSVLFPEWFDDWIADDNPVRSVRSTPR